MARYKSTVLGTWDGGSHWTTLASDTDITSQSSSTSNRSVQTQGPLEPSPGQEAGMGWGMSFGVFLHTCMIMQPYHQDQESAVSYVYTAGWDEMHLLPDLLSPNQRSRAPHDILAPRAGTASRLNRSTK